MITFSSGPLSSAGNDTYAYEPWLFQLPTHLTIQAPTGWGLFTARNDRSEEIVAQLPFHRDGFLAVSPLRAPFGSVQCASSLRAADLYAFTSWCCEELRRLGVEELRLTNPPAGLQPRQSALLTTFLLNLGFEITKAEVSMLLPVDEFPFHTHLHNDKKNKLQKQNAERVVFRALPETALREVYDFLLACRQERGYHLSIDWHTLEKTRDAFPDRFHLFAVYHHQQLAAASIAIDVGNHVLYDFVSGHPRLYDWLSPVVKLKEGMYGFCVENNFRTLDLGTSAKEGQPNFGLLDFKEDIGGLPSVKLSFRKRL